MIQVPQSPTPKLQLNFQPDLTVIVPFFNEERTLHKLMENLIGACPGAQIILVNDGSTDGSPAIAQALIRTSDVVLSQSNGGKGSAIRAAIPKALGRYTVIQDADLEYDPHDILMLMKYADAHALPAVFGSRRLKPQNQYAHVSYYIGGVLLTFLCNVLFGTRLTDQPTCYKLVRTDILRSLALKQDDFRFDGELTALLALRGIPIAEQPISYAPRSRAEGKKIGAMDWFACVGLFLKLRMQNGKIQSG